jgi:hypothetical protein
MGADGAFIRPAPTTSFIGISKPGDSFRTPKAPPAKKGRDEGTLPVLNLIARSNGQADILPARKQVSLSPVNECAAKFQFGSPRSTSLTEIMQSQAENRKTHSLKDMSDEALEAIKQEKIEANKRSSLPTHLNEEGRRRRAHTGVLGLPQWKSDLLIYEVARIILRNNGSQLMARLGAVMSPVGRQILQEEECKLKRFLHAVPEYFVIKGESGIETIEFIGDVNKLRKPDAKAMLGDDELRGISEAEEAKISELLDYHCEQFELDGRPINTMAQCLREIRNIMAHCVDGQLLMSQFGAKLRPELRIYLRNAHIKLQMFLEMFPEEFTMSGPSGKEMLNYHPEKKDHSEEVLLKHKDNARLNDPNPKTTPDARMNQSSTWVPPPPEAPVSYKTSKGYGKGKGKGKGQKGRDQKQRQWWGESNPTVSYEQFERTPKWADAVTPQHNWGMSNLEAEKRQWQAGYSDAWKTELETPAQKQTLQLPTPKEVQEWGVGSPSERQCSWSPMNNFHMPTWSPAQLPGREGMTSPVSMIGQINQTPYLPMMPPSAVTPRNFQSQMSLDCGVTPSKKKQFDRLLTMESRSGTVDLAGAEMPVSPTVANFKQVFNNHDAEELSKMITDSAPVCYED